MFSGKNDMASDHDLLMCGLCNFSGCVVIRKYGECLASSEAIMLGLPYVLDLRELVVSNGAQRRARINEVRDAVLEMKPISSASWNEEALEEFFINTVGKMQELWRIVNRGKLSAPFYENQIAHLPFVFLNWESLDRFVRLTKKLFALIDIPLSDDKVLKYAFYEMAAGEFYRYDFNNLDSFNYMAFALLMAGTEVTRFTEVERKELLKGLAMHKHIVERFDAYGFGTIEQMRKCAEMFDRFAREDTPRIELSSYLLDIMK